MRNSSSIKFSTLITKFLIFKNLKNRRGSLLVEAIIGISIAVLGLLGIVGVLSSSLALNKDVGQKLTATYLAAEGVEIMKGIIDTYYTLSPRPSSWNANIFDGSYELVYDSTSLGSNLGINVLSNTPLSLDFGNGVYSYSGGNTIPSSFKRTIFVTNSQSGNEIKVVSRVDWLDRGVAKQISLEDHFFDWR